MPVTEDEAMVRALAAAREAAGHGDVPIGAVLLDGGEIVAVAGNRREADSDPTAHAELLVLREGARRRGSWRLDGTTLVVTLEPCPMCAGAALLSRVARIVYGAPDPKAGACGSLYNLCADPRLNHDIAVVRGVRAAESAALLQAFFTDRRGEAANGGR